MEWESRVRGYVEEHAEAHLAELVEYVGRPSVSATGEGFPEVARYVADLAGRCGLSARVVPTSGHPAVVAHGEGDPGAPRVLIYGHYDVQPPGPLGQWHSPPFEATVRDGRLYGRGTGDNKGQHLAHLLALRMIARLRGASRLPCPVTVLLDGEEEVGSPHLGEVVTGHADELACDLAVVSDGPVQEDGRAVVKLGVRGIVQFELRARGAAYPLHSGNWGGVAPNPAWRLVWLLASMRAPDGRVLVPGFDGGAAPLTPGELAALGDLPVDVPAALAVIGASELDVPREAGYYQRLTRPTLTINSLTCEDEGDHRPVIPSVAVARCEVRLVGGQSADEVGAALAAHVRHVAPDVEFVRVRHGVEASRTLPESEYTGTIRTAVGAALGHQPALKPAMGGTLPLHVLTDGLGVPAYGVPLANADEANHAPNENLEIRRFHDGIRVSAAILSTLAANHGRTVAA